jgi:3'-5' exoribonuclease
MTPTPTNSLRNVAADLGVTNIASVVLDDPRFSTWSVSSQPYQHHYGTGMLAQHTWEVVSLCLANRRTLSILRLGLKDAAPLPTERAVFLAGLYHDIGKVEDYTEVAPGNWAGTPHKRLIHHISRSGIIWARAVDRFPAYRDIEDEVLHDILAHHGTRAWGSPVAPKTRLAWLLHLSDCLSARYNDADTLDVVKHYEA